MKASLASRIPWRHRRRFAVPLLHQRREVVRLLRCDLRAADALGDNLDVLRRHVEDASVDLVYLDPPFNSLSP